ncbi:MAG: AMIN domain-containing protein [Nostoc sp.]|uniref:AMIN domain-containing protein n=1 Tax=Nostoc sp. TaxID=1180 RepID=UPI002FF0B03A
MLTKQCQLLFIVSTWMWLIATPAWAQGNLRHVNTAQTPLKLSFVKKDAVGGGVKRQKRGELPASEIPHLNEINRAATSIKQWLSQSLIPITGVKLNTTDKGLEVILETSQGQQLQLTNRSQGNSFVVDIPNAQLRLLSTSLA